MSSIEIVFPDGARREFPKGITGEEIAQSIFSRTKTSVNRH